MSRDTQVERIVDALTTTMSDHQIAALNKQSGTEFEFGRACGIHHGLSLAIELVRDVLAQDERPRRVAP
jgi:hypothetical protein